MKRKKKKKNSNWLRFTPQNSNRKFHSLVQYSCRTAREEKNRFLSEHPHRILCICCVRLLFSLFRVFLVRLLFLCPSTCAIAYLKTCYVHHLLQWIHEIQGKTHSNFTSGLMSFFSSFSLFVSLFFNSIGFVFHLTGIWWRSREHTPVWSSLILSFGHKLQATLNY